MWKIMFANFVTKLRLKISQNAIKTVEHQFNYHPAVYPL